MMEGHIYLVAVNATTKYFNICFYSMSKDKQQTRHGKAPCYHIWRIICMISNKQASYYTMIISIISHIRSEYFYQPLTEI